MVWKVEDLAQLEESLLIGSTLVEGSTLTEEQARLVLRGKTISGHSISEIRELTNYRASIEWLIQEFQSSPYLSLDLIAQFHRRLFSGFPGDHGRWKLSQNYTFLSDGICFSYVPPHEVESQLRRWVEDFNRPPGSGTLAGTAIEQAAKLYYRFEGIHPFQDGNGRIGRVLAAYYLARVAGLTFEFRLRDRIEHLNALESANRKDFSLLIEFFANRTHQEK